LAQRLRGAQPGQRPPDDHDSVHVDTFPRGARRISTAIRSESTRIYVENPEPRPNLVATDGGSSVDPVSIGREVTVGSADRRVPTVDEINEMLATAFPGTESMCAAVGADFAVARRIVGPDALRPGGFISGPTQFGVADAALWYLVFGAIGRVEPMALTSELSIRYLRPAQGDVLFARATLDSAGRRNVVGTVRMWCDDREHKPTATAQGTYVLPAA
jgi:acyl-coenzyme A thioesterase PaaI-like protein